MVCILVQMLLCLLLVVACSQTHLTELATGKPFVQSLLPTCQSKRPKLLQYYPVLCGATKLHLFGGSDNSIKTNHSEKSITENKPLDPATRAVQKLEMLRRSGKSLCIEDFNDAICECWRGGRWDISLDLYWSLIKEGLNPNRVTFNAVLGACARGNKYDVAEKVFSDMCKCNIEADEITYNAMIISLARYEKISDNSKRFLDGHIFIQGREMA